MSRFKQFLLRCRLRNKKFTIISNNCWGGFISRRYGLPYRSPTCGLMIIGDDYVRFCSDLRHYTQEQIKFIPFESSKHHSSFQMAFPVGVIDDIEIYFMHYSSEQEAAEKWYRRCKRINWDYIIYKISERKSFTEKNMMDFAALPLENKLIFATKKYSDDTIVVSGIKDIVGDETPTLYKVFDEAKYLNHVYKNLKNKHSRRV